MTWRVDKYLQPSINYRAFSLKTFRNLYTTDKLRLITKKTFCLMMWVMTASLVFAPHQTFAQDLATVPQTSVSNTQKSVQSQSELSQSLVTAQSDSVKIDSRLKQSMAAVAMPDKYSANAAKQVLQSGGNAVDAAIAAAFVLAVTYPEAGNIGGGGFMTLVLPSLSPKNLKQDNEKIQTAQLTQQAGNRYFLDYREMAPQAAFKDLYLDRQGEVVAYQSLIGYQASGVPGTVMGMWQVHQQFASLPWETLLQPAIRLAEQGFAMPESMFKTAQWFENWIQQNAPAGEKSKLNFQRFLQNRKAGELFIQPELAETLQRIAKNGAKEFYFGETAKQLVEQVQKHKGLITSKDLAGYRAKWRQPIVGEWFGKTIVSAPPPSSGGIALVQLLKLYEILKPKYIEQLEQAKKEGVPESVVRAHFYAELSKRVYADRAHYLGDPDFVEVPSQKLMGLDYLQTRAKSVRLDEISDTESIKPGIVESPETTHFSIIDAQGNAVSNTYTLNMPFGNGVFIEKAGFLMNNEMDDFSIKPGVANVFGVVGASANAIAPEKRMLSSMTPTVVTQGESVEMVLGTPGGSTIITSIFQTLINVYERQMTSKQAIDAPRVHHQLLPKNQIAFHPELSVETQEGLELMGYHLKRNNYLGDVQVITKFSEKIEAAADMRGRGVADVFTISK